MVFALSAIVGTATYSLTDGNPFSLESADGLGAPSVRRLSQGGPFANERIDLGYRTAPRVVTLALNFQATSGSALDVHRATLNSFLSPSLGTPVYLQVTRDDGGTRTLECEPVGPMTIPVVALHRPGSLHKAVIQLRAADPFWYDSATGTALTTGAGTINVVNSGDIPVWPIIRLQYVGTVSMTNTTTGGTISMGTYSLVSNYADVDCRPAHRTFVNYLGVSQISQLPEPSDMHRFYLAPGTNTIIVTAGTSYGAAVSFNYTPQYLSF